MSLFSDGPKEDAKDRRIRELEAENKNLRIEVEALRAAAYSGAKVRKRDPKTAHDAAAKSAVNWGNQRYSILVYLRDKGPATATQWESDLKMSHSPRCTELKRAGHIKVVGTAPTKFNAEAELYAITESGQRAVRLADLKHQDKKSRSA